MRSAEEWATHCHKESHWIAWSAGQGGAEKILCINCARAFARECVEAWREQVIELVAEWERAYPEEIFRPVSEGEQGASSDRIAAQQGRHMARSLQKALRALPGETP